MPSQKQISQHPAFTLATELENICEPLQTIGITYFSHVRISDSYQIAGLGLEPKFVDLYIKKKYYNFDVHMLKLTQLEQFILWDSISLDKESEEIDNDLKHLGLGHSFSIIQKNGNLVDCYHFGAKRGLTQINQRYLQNIDLLKKFINYFNFKLSTNKDLAKAYDIKFDIDLVNGGYFIKNELDGFAQNKFNNKIATERMYLENGLYLTKQEWHCLYWLSQGKTLQQVANQLTITERTVKAHVNNIKKKFSCNNLFQLGVMFSKLQNSIP